MIDNKQINKQGFSLIEMVLVMAIISGIVVMATNYMARKGEAKRIDDMVLKMQYILNAARAAYIASADGVASGGRWPGDNDTLYLVRGPGSNPLQPNFLGPNEVLDMSGYPFWIIHPTDNSYGSRNTFHVLGCVPGNPVKSAATASLIASRLPLGYTIRKNGMNCNGTLAAAYTLLPGQSINNSMAVKFAGTYNHGACVPVPMCQSTATGSGVTMTPEVFVYPVSVSGFNNPVGGSKNIYPISSFTSYAVGPATNPSGCKNSVGAQPVCSLGNNNNLYWRVCLQVITEAGNAQQGNATEWGKDVTLSAFTRCRISNEPSGSDFTVFGN